MHRFATVAVVFLVQLLYTGANVCFRGFRPFNMGIGLCGFPMGGQRREMGVFIRSYQSCCRRIHAQGWGVPNACQSCLAIRGVASPWTTWSTCSNSCGLGRQTRRRTCSTTVCAGMRSKRAFQTRQCTWSPCCPVDGHWSSWSESTGCTVTCGTGIEFRSRVCNSPQPQCGGLDCPGPDRQFKECYAVHCHQPGTWGQWAPQGPCSATCGEGTAVRYRECIPFRGNFCEGPSQDQVPCNEGFCPETAEWCPWTDWESCSRTCGTEPGTTKRSRRCACPSPSNGSEPCRGLSEETKICNATEPCPVNGGWGNWLSWSQCSSAPCSINKGYQIRMRACDHPSPSHNGRLCDGNYHLRRRCLNMGECRVEGFLSQWSIWSQCSETCGRCGSRKRTRVCQSPFANTEEWQVDVVVGQPNLLCNQDRLIENLPCTLPRCPDGTDPCGVAMESDIKYHSHHHHHHSHNHDLGINGNRKLDNVQSKTVASLVQKIVSSTGEDNMTFEKTSEGDVLSTNNEKSTDSEVHIPNEMTAGVSSPPLDFHRITKPKHPTVDMLQRISTNKKLVSPRMSEGVVTHLRGINGKQQHTQIYTAAEPLKQNNPTTKQSTEINRASDITSYSTATPENLNNRGKVSTPVDKRTSFQLEQTDTPTKTESAFPLTTRPRETTEPEPSGKSGTTNKETSQTLLSQPLDVANTQGGAFGSTTSQTTLEDNTSARIMTLQKSQADKIGSSEVMDASTPNHVKGTEPVTRYASSVVKQFTTNVPELVSSQFTMLDETETFPKTVGGNLNPTTPDLDSVSLQDQQTSQDQQTTLPPVDNDQSTVFDMAFAPTTIALDPTRLTEVKPSSDAKVFGNFVKASVRTPFSTKHASKNIRTTSPRDTDDQDATTTTEDMTHKVAEHEDLINTTVGTQTKHILQQKDFSLKGKAVIFEDISSQAYGATTDAVVAIDAPKGFRYSTYSSDRLVSTNKEKMNFDDQSSFTSISQGTVHKQNSQIPNLIETKDSNFATHLETTSPTFTMPTTSQRTEFGRPGAVTSHWQPTENTPTSAPAKDITTVMTEFNRMFMPDAKFDTLESVNEAHETAYVRKGKYEDYALGIDLTTDMETKMSTQTRNIRSIAPPRVQDLLDSTSYMPVLSKSGTTSSFNKNLRYSAANSYPGSTKQEGFTTKWEQHTVTTNGPQGIDSGNGDSTEAEMTSAKLSLKTFTTKQSFLVTDDRTVDAKLTEKVIKIPDISQSESTTLPGLTAKTFTTDQAVTRVSELTFEESNTTEEDVTPRVTPTKLHSETFATSDFGSTFISSTVFDQTKFQTESPHKTQNKIDTTSANTFSTAGLSEAEQIDEQVSEFQSPPGQSGPSSHMPRVSTAGKPDFDTTNADEGVYASATTLSPIKRALLFPEKLPYKQGLFKEPATTNVVLQQAKTVDNTKPPTERQPTSPPEVDDPTRPSSGVAKTVYVTYITVTTYVVETELIANSAEKGHKNKGLTINKTMLSNYTLELEGDTLQQDPLNNKALAARNSTGSTVELCKSSVPIPFANTPVPAHTAPIATTTFDFLPQVADEQEHSSPTFTSPSIDQGSFDFPKFNQGIFFFGSDKEDEQIPPVGHNRHQGDLDFTSEIEFDSSGLPPIYDAGSEVDYSTVNGLNGNSENYNYHEAVQNTRTKDEKSIMTDRSEKDTFLRDQLLQDDFLLAVADKKTTQKNRSPKIVKSDIKTPPVVHKVPAPTTSLHISTSEAKEKVLKTKDTPNERSGDQDVDPHRVNGNSDALGLNVDSAEHKMIFHDESDELILNMILVNDTAREILPPTDQDYEMDHSESGDYSSSDYPLYDDSHVYDEPDEEQKFKKPKISSICGDLPLSPELERCCKVVNDTYGQDDDAMSSCLSLLFETEFGLNDEMDLESAISARGVTRCLCRNRKDYMKVLCCRKPVCSSWRKPMHRSLCKACQPFCQPCHRPILIG